MQKFKWFWHRCAASLGICGLLVSGGLVSGTHSFAPGIINGVRQVSAAARYWEYDGLPTRTAPKRPPAFAELEMRVPDTPGNLPLRLARETAFAFLHQEDGGLGPEGHYYGSWDRAGLDLEVHMKGNIRGVFVMYNRTAW